jgi:hypothetical protein
MGFVNGDTGELAVRMDYSENLAEIVELTVLWGHVEETGERMATL